MIFKPEPYFYNYKDKESQLDKVNSNYHFKNGILIDAHVLFYLILGNYAKNLENISSANIQRFGLKEEENIGFKAITNLLNKIKILTNTNPPLLITPHIFTKFINLLWLRISKKDNDYKRILELLKDDFSYIREEEIKKEVLIGLDNFRNRVFGISEASLSILKNRINKPCILCCNNKILSEYEEDFLFVDFKELMDFTKEDERKNELI